METARGILGKLAVDIIASAPPEERVLLAWSLACGTRVAARTQAAQFTGKSLLVQVPDAAWRQQLQQMTPQYVQALRAMSGEEIESIRFVVGTNVTQP